MNLHNFKCTHKYDKDIDILLQLYLALFDFFYQPFNSHFFDKLIKLLYFSQPPLFASNHRIPSSVPATEKYITILYC